MLKFIIFIIFYGSASQSQSLYRHEVIVDYLDFPKNDEIFDYGTLRVKKHNRTSYVLNGYIDLLKPFSDEITGKFVLCAYQGNEYRKLGEKKIEKMCTYLQQDKMVVAKTIHKTSLAPEIKSCPIEPQRLHLYDVSMPNDFLPVQPAKCEKYRLDVMYFIDDRMRSNFSFYFLLKKIIDVGLPKLG